LKFINPIIFSFLIGINVCAQHTIDGKVTHANGEALAYVNVVLYQQADSSFVEGTISEEDGHFHFENIEKGKYFIEASYVGYLNSKLSFLLEEDKNLPALVLKEGEEYLDEVNIRIKNPEIRKESDRIIFDIENTSLSSGDTWEALKKTPGVINIQNDLKVRNTSATIYINDRKVDITKDELQQLLQSYSAENVKQIEVLRNPPAKYDAGDGPIINIVTTKILVPGYKGSLHGSYTQAIYAKYNLGTSHYYKKGNLNIFGNYSFSPSKSIKQDQSYINYINEDNEVFQSWRTDFDRTTKEENHNANLMVDYELNEENTLSFRATSLYTPNKTYDNQGITNIYNQAFELDSLFTTKSHLNNDLLNVAYDLSYQHTFNSSTNLSANFHSTYYNEEKDQIIFTDYINAENELLNQNSFATDADQKINIYSGQLDFETKFGEFDFLSGIKYADINSSSLINFYSVESNSRLLDNAYLSDRYQYDESVYAGYSSISKNWKKFKTKLGLRVEHTDREGYSITLKEFNQRSYTRFFPSLYVSYEASEEHNFSFDYGRKINRPKYGSLNPFFYFITEKSFRFGNPTLRASISNEFNLNYTFKSKYSFDFYYRDNGENVNQLAFQNNTNLFLSFVQVNVLRSKSYGIDFLHGRSIKNWWYAQAYLSAYHEEETFVALESNNAEVTNDVNGLYASIYNSLTFSKDGTFTGDITLFYMSSFISGSYQVGGRSNLSFGLTKKIWKNRAEVSLHVADIFNDFAPQFNSTYLNQDNGYYALPENRYVRIGFKYNFGNFGLKDNSRSINAEERDRL
tara:strand:- start:3262 stop:5664 length:2403 start_codon:yes stop_codon:yes gene_type:complete